MSQFIEGLKRHSLEDIRVCAKADLHNHFVLGGSREYIKRYKNIEIMPLERPLSSMQEMNGWSDKYIGSRFDSSDMRKFLIEATFQQAKNDGVTVLEIGEDVWGLGEFFRNDIHEFINAFYEAKAKIAPDMELRLQIGLSRHCSIGYLEDCLSHFWGNSAFYSIDLYGDEMAQPIETFIPFIAGLRKKAFG